MTSSREHALPILDVHPDGRALAEVFPWTRHLSAAEVHEFVSDLVDAPRDAAHADLLAYLHRVIVEWRATARILADPDLTAQLTTPYPAC